MLKTLRRRKIRIGPEDDGRRMSLDEFDRAAVKEGYLYELSKGVVDVSEIPGPDHAREVQAVRNPLVVYQEKHSDEVYLVAGSNEAKLLIGSHRSERHPDIAVYLSPAPDVPDVWSIWVPAIVVEIVSGRSAQRDYEDKPDEYLEFGVTEYWIVDSAKQQITVLIRWRGQWKKQIVKAPQKYSTGILPGFTLDLKRIFSAAKRK